LSTVNCQLSTVNCQLSTVEARVAKKRFFTKTGVVTRRFRTKPGYESRSAIANCIITNSLKIIWAIAISRSIRDF
ncbi:hypothetical protein, partial [Microcoleus sp. herbarium12]|uniref:hypothetical protein n=1 Tax=Microcoleus sp. herbarium12 TaxID=3055437 RepID=UPI002FCEDDFD